MAELEKHEKFDLRLNSQVKQVTHAPGNVTATFQNLKTKETDSVSGTVVSSYVNSNRGCYHMYRYTLFYTATNVHFIIDKFCD